MSWNKGVKGYHIHSEEWKKKRSEELKGRASPMKGKRHSLETIEKIRKGNLGKKYSKETREKISAARMGKGNGMYGKTHSEKYKQWLRDNTSGENGNNWKGGITPEHKLRLTRAEWTEIRLEVYKRDNWTCQRCGVKCTNSKKLSWTTIQCHHIESWRTTKNDSLKNLVTLCLRCHGIVENERDVNHFWEHRKNIKYEQTINTICNSLRKMRL